MFEARPLILNRMQLHMFVYVFQTGPGKPLCSQYIHPLISQVARVPITAVKCAELIHVCIRLGTWFSSLLLRTVVCLTEAW